MIKDDAVFLGHMLEYALLVQETIGDLSESDFISHRDSLHLAVYRLHIIGEAARNVSLETREKYPQIPWTDIIALRNRLVHGYFDINASVVFNIAKDELPMLISNLINIVPLEYQTSGN